MKEKIYNFFENPKGFLAYAVQALIFLLIFVSVGIVIVEFFYHETFKKYETLLHIVNYVVLAAFTAEYVLRLVTAPKKIQFVKKPLNIVDFFAVAPNYVELLLPFFIPTSELRILRVIRLLRFTRMLRLLKVFKYGALLKRVFVFQGTIIEAILPILAIFVALKCIIWGLEFFRLWFTNADLGNLFAIIGFALGIILSQKIGVSYDKFIQVEEAVIRLYGSLRSLTLILDRYKKNLGTKTVREWAQSFLALLQDSRADNFTIHSANSNLYLAVTRVERQPSELAILCGEIAKDAAFCLSKKVRITPKAYDTLLHQATLMYLALIALFIPGVTGLISIVVATYILYGMYRLTQDLDSIVGGEFNLINIDVSELTYISKEVKSK